MSRTHRVSVAGMSKRKQSRYDNPEAGRYRPMQRTVAGAEPLRSLYAGPKRFRSNRFYAGRGTRPGPSMYRRFRGLRSYPQSGIETKFFDTSLSAAAIQAPAASAVWSGLEQCPTTVLCFNAMSQGTGASNREGRLITMESLQINGVVRITSQADQTAADTVPVIKYWVVLDKQTNGGTATGLDSENVFTNPVATALGGVNPLRNMLYSRRYKILKAGVINPLTLPVSYDGTNMEQEGLDTQFDCFIKLKGLRTEFSADSAPSNRSDIVTNGLFFIMCASTTSTAPTVTYNARLRFRG